MMYTWKKPTYWFAGICMLLCLWGAPGFAAQTVQVVRPLEPGETALSVRDQVLKDGFVQGIVQEADVILPVPMDEARKPFFISYLHDTTQNLILSYKELGFKEQGDEPREAVANLSVSVNRAQLKEMLKDMGVFYTTTRHVSYALTLTGLQAEDWQRLEQLQTLTGVDVVYGESQSQTGGVTVRLNKIAQDSWQGELSAFGNHFTARGKDLDGLWFRLWKGYFQLPEVIAGVFSTVTFSVAGWYVTDGAAYFEKILLSWNRLVEQATLKHLDMSDTDLGGVWSVQTRDVQALRAKLETFLRDRGLHLLFFQQEMI